MRTLVWLGMLALPPMAAHVEAQSASIYTYDSLGRLSTVREGTGHATDYSYDRASNRTLVKSVNQFEYSFAAVSLYHIVGRAEGGGWAASVEDPEGHMIFGPYTYTVSQGDHVAAFRILIDNNSADNAAVAVVDVADGSNGAAIASRILYRKDWNTASHYEVFELPFNLGPQYSGKPIEFRVYYLRRAYLRVSQVGFR